MFIDNSDVMPKYIPDDLMLMEDVDDEGKLQTPAWFKQAIIVEVRLDTASTDGTLEGLEPMLKHYREMGVNCLWVTPVGEMGTSFGDHTNGYTVNGVHTIDPRLTGTSDFEEGWRRFAKFVELAHTYDIRILLDFTIWGVDKEAQFAIDHPEYFMLNEDGSFKQNAWGGPSYDIHGEVFRKWYSDEMIKIIQTTGIDGLRLDLEPHYGAYDFWREIRKRAYEMGRKIVIMTEAHNEREDVFDIEQYGIVSYKNNWDEAQTAYGFAPARRTFIDDYNLVDAVKEGYAIGSRPKQNEGTSGNYRYYTHALCWHDWGEYFMDNNQLNTSYQAIFAPFIPLWMMGEEMNCPYRLPVEQGPLYYTAAFDLTSLDNPDNRYFYETLKKHIRIRRSYPEIFEYFPLHTRESNICKVWIDGLQKWQAQVKFDDKGAPIVGAYARYDGKGKAIIIVPNNNSRNADATIKVTIPFAEAKLEGYHTYKITDLMDEKEILCGNREEVEHFEVFVKNQELGVYLVEAVPGK